MKRVLAIGVLVGLLTGAHRTQAQTSRDPEDISTGQLLEQRLETETLAGSTQQAALGKNQAALLQLGNQNQASIDQRIIGVGQGNTASINQNGTSNLAAILQNGAGSRTIISQAGANNVASSEINGYNTESEILQKGNGNRVDQRLNVDDRRYSVEQMGNNNNLVQRESGSTAPGYEVTMKGNGIRIIIEQGRASTMP
ncbi:hypothetical protein [Hymenobacter metallicola]|uniref:Curlin associated repeat-containing protein n=1 Tax=Hymenobacter metallicola TaxID=2563114 RepID=A0A4Z0QDD6_9BACT|nr:hypothetical protein [Hymenobacter metallicola]TGE28067.1 hypothetical protein E5K02_00970 [Hymenobacter metallicola]